jgi:hypothetical protein
VTGGGKGLIHGGTLAFRSSFSENVRFTGHRSPGALVLGQSQTYAGTISGFSRKGVTTLDLRDIGFVDSGEATFSGKGRRGVLTVTDGTHTAQIHLKGHFSRSTFVASDDGHGGVSIVASSAHVASVHPFVAAMASLGGGSAGAIHWANEPHAFRPTLIAAARMHAA